MQFGCLFGHYRIDRPGNGTGYGNYPDQEIRKEKDKEVRKEVRKEIRKENKIKK
jgi:hypothetical protein